MDVYNNGLFNGFVLGVVVTIGTINTYKLYKHEIKQKINSLFKSKKKPPNPRKRLPTYSNNVIQFPTKKQG